MDSSSNSSSSSNSHSDVPRPARYALVEFVLQKMRMLRRVAPMRSATRPGYNYAYYTARGYFVAFHFLVERGVTPDCDQRDEVYQIWDYFHLYKPEWMMPNPTDHTTLPPGM